MSNEFSPEGQQTKWIPVDGEEKILYTFFTATGYVPISLPASKPIRTSQGEVRADSLKSDEYGEMWAKTANETEFRWHKVQRNAFFTVKLG
jgi:hypothetical protein